MLQVPAAWEIVAAMAGGAGAGAGRGLGLGHGHRLGHKLGGDEGENEEGRRCE